MNARDEPWRVTPAGVVIACRLTPKGGRDAIEGTKFLSDGASVLIARVREAPEDGRANDALRALLAKTLDVSVSRVRLVSGGKNRLKQIAVEGDPLTLVARLSALS